MRARAELAEANTSDDDGEGTVLSPGSTFDTGSIILNDPSLGTAGAIRTCMNITTSGITDRSRGPADFRSLLFKR